MFERLRILVVQCRGTGAERRVNCRNAVDELLRRMMEDLNLLPDALSVEFEPARDRLGRSL